MSETEVCRTCKGKGFYEAYPLDGFAHYHWVKPYKYACFDCELGRKSSHRYKVA